MVVLAVTAQDVEAAAVPGTGATAPSTPRPPSAPVWFSDDVVAGILESGQFALSGRTVEAAKGGPFPVLLDWLQQPQPHERAGFADALPLFFVPGATLVQVPEGTLAPAAATLLAEGSLHGPSTALWWRRGHLGVLCRLIPRPGALSSEIAVVLDDRDSALADPAHAAAWREWLGLANALNLRTQPVTVTTLTAAGEPVRDSVLARPGTAGSAAGGVPDSAGGSGDVPLPPQWTSCIADAASAVEETFLRALARQARVPVPRVGFESDEGIVIDAAWPDHKIAAYVAVEPADRDDLASAGWKVVEATVDAVTAALAAAGAMRETTGGGH
jgi:hypothetical protein